MNIMGLLALLLLIFVVGIVLSIFAFYAIIYVFSFIDQLLFGREDFHEDCFDDYDDI